MQRTIRRFTDLDSHILTFINLFDILLQMETSMTAIIERRERPRSAPCYAEALPMRLSAEAVQQFSEDLQILAHPIRMQILDILDRGAGQICVCDLEAACRSSSRPYRIILGCCARPG
jgi:hypothetical protein